MSDFHIRLYKDSDYSVARDIFSRGLSEQIQASWRHSLRLGRIWLLLLAVFLLTFYTTSSTIISFIAASSIILLLWLIIRRIMVTYIQSCLEDDMMDIRSYYLQRDGCCFWVAEAGGEVVGTVGVAPLPHPDGREQVELKRLSVHKLYRRRGIATALCRKAIDFSRKAGYQAVVLETSICLKHSIHLYRRMGFRIIAKHYPNYHFTKFIDFVDLYFQYDL